MPPHPLLHILGNVSVSCAVIGCTAPDSKVARSGALLVMALSTWQCITTCKHILIRSPWANLLGGYSVSLLFHYLDIALLEPWSFHQQRLLPKLQSGLSLTLNPRFIGTSQQIKHVSRHTASLSRKTFLWRTGALILLSYLILDILDSSADPEMTARYLSQQNVPLLRRLIRHELSGEEAIMRFFSVLGAGIGLVAVQGGCYGIFAFFSVLCDVSSPYDWPPLYGSISDAYTLRQLWSLCWHQLNTHKLNSISRYITHNILGIPRGSRGLSVRYMRLAIAFVSSGLMHLLIDMSIGLTIYTSGALSCFSTQILGIAIEDTIIAVYRRAIGEGGIASQPHSPPSKAQRAIGYVWVCAFLVWTVPAYMYPIISLNDASGGDAVVPVSLIGMLRRL